MPVQKQSNSCYLAILVCIGIAQSALPQPQTHPANQLSLHGVVVTKSTNELVSGAVVSVEGGGKDTTGLNGEFTIDAFPNDVTAAGDSIVLHVMQYVVVSPYDGARGKFNLPNPKGKDPIAHVEVCHSKEPHCLLTVASIRDMLYENAYKFEAISTEARLLYPELRPKDLIALRSDRSRITNVGLKLPLAGLQFGQAVGAPVQAQLQGPCATDTLRFFERQASDTGLSVAEICGAVDTWDHEASTAYDKALAAVALQNYQDAVTFTTAALKNRGSALRSEVVLARAQYQLGHVDLARSALAAAMRLAPKDPVLKANLSIVDGQVTVRPTDAPPACNTLVANYPPTRSDIYSSPIDPIPGAPFSARRTVQWNGPNETCFTYYQTVARDTLGRLRGEWSSAIAEHTTDEPRLVRFEITDPIFGERTTCEVEKKACIRTAWLQSDRPNHPSDIYLEGTPGAFNRVYLGVNLDTGLRLLGYRDILIPAAPGPSQITNEIWYSPRYHFTLYELRAVPAAGIILSIRLINLKFQEPDKQLLSIPIDYVITNAPSK